MTAAAIEYGVRATLPGGDIVVFPVTDEVLMRQRAVELLDEGARDVEPVTRPRPLWTVDHDAKARIEAERAREAILSIAIRVWEEDLTAEAAVVELAEHSSLPKAVRADRLATLIGELEHQEQIEYGEYDANLTAPYEDHDTLLGDAERRVNEAADALVGRMS